MIMLSLLLLSGQPEKKPEDTLAVDIQFSESLGKILYNGSEYVYQPTHQPHYKDNQPRTWKDNTEYKTGILIYPNKSSQKDKIKELIELRAKEDDDPIFMVAHIVYENAQGKNFYVVLKMDYLPKEKFR